MKILVEGEGEVGSPALGALLSAHRDELTADAVLLADGVDVAPATGKMGVIHAMTPKSDLMEAVYAAFSAAYGTELRRIESGGNIPLVAQFTEAFPNASLLVTSAGTDPQARIHSVDESLSLTDFHNACLAEALLLTEIASRNDKAPAQIVI